MHSAIGMTQVSFSYAYIQNELQFLLWQDLHNQIQFNLKTEIKHITTGVDVSGGLKICARKPIKSL